MANRERETIDGLAVSVHGRHCVVEISDGNLLHCYPRGKSIKVACGDNLKIERSGDAQGAVTEVLPRTSLLYRSERFRQKVIAANVTQALLVVAAKPAFHEDLLSRCLVACEQQDVRALIVLNKIDLAEETKPITRELQLYESLGYTVVPISAQLDISPVLPHLRNQRSVLVGQSGMGKSTIVNALMPDARARTAEYSQKLDAGKHTTTSARLYHLDETSSIIDSPGLQTFGLHHLSHADLVRGFPEFRPFAGQCRFDNCRHTVEPGCIVIDAVEKQLIDQQRWATYRSLADEQRSGAR